MGENMQDINDGVEEEGEESMPDSLREWASFATEVAFKMLEEVQGCHLVRLKEETKIGDAAEHTTEQKLMKLKQMADFFLGISSKHDW